MSAYRIEGPDEPGRFAEEWEQLADRTAAGPFVRPGWVEAWWRAFGRGRLEIVALRGAADGGLHALLPLQRRGDALCSPTNWHSPEFGLLADRTDAARELVGRLLESQPRRLALDFLDERQAELVGAAASEHGYRVLRRVRQRSPYVALAGVWNDFERRLDRRVRSEARRREALLRGRGRLECEVTAGEGLEAALEEGFAIEGSGWKAARGTAINSRPETVRFYADVARWAAARGWLRLAFLRLDGRPLAFNLCFELGRRHYLVKSGFDPAFAGFGPGKLLRHRMLARAFEQGFETYEFLGEATPAKLECARALRERHLVQGFRPSPLGVLDWSAFAIARPLVKRLLDAARRRPRQVLPSH